MAAGSVMPPTIVPLRTLEASRSAAGKQFIGTDTPIELRSVTPSAEIFFTVDGTRPEVRQRYGQKTTHRYTKPIKLLTGKQVIKAVARDRDERESAVVTKTFFVSFTEEEQKPPEDQRNSRMGSHSNLSSSTPELQRRQDLSSSNNSLAPRSTSGGAHFLSSRFDRSMRITDLSEVEFGEWKNFGTEHFKEPKRTLKTPAEVFHEGQQTDFIVCVYCHGRRPNDPFSRFCPNCSAPIPQVPPRRASPPEPGEFGQCLYCQNTVPLGTAKCVVCDAPMEPQLQPRATKRLQRRIICTGCGMANPPDMGVCVACETKLTAPVKEIAIDEVRSSPQGSVLPYIPYCRACSRELAADAKWCDMCGRKVVNPNEPIVCGKCKSNNSGANIYCTGCGISLEKYAPRSSTSMSTSMDAIDGPAGKKEKDWLVVPPPKPAVPLKTQATQTDGLFYPSAKSLENLRGAELERIVSLVHSQDKASKDLTQTSPGKGYWRQQTDHVCAHIKAYSQNSPDFQTAIAHQLMGRVLAATARQEDKELTLSFTFDLRGKDGKMQSGPGSKTTTFTSSLSRSTTPASNMTEVISRPASAGASLSGLLMASSGYARATGTSRQELPRRPATSSATSSTKSTRRRKSKPMPKLSQSPEECLLLRELGPDGDGRKERVVKLLCEGAGANCRDRQSLPALSVAAANGRVECVCILVDNGARLNQQDVSGNTALHAAIVRGDCQVACVEELLRCGVNADVQNKLGQTAYELAVARNLPPLIRCLASNVGTQLLAPLSKLKTMAPKKP